MSTNLGDLLKNAGLKPSDSPVASAEVPSSGPAFTFGPKVVVRTTKRGRGGKTVTEVQGVLGDLAILAKSLRKRMGVGAKAEGALIIVQGDQRDRLIPMLTDHGAKRIVRSGG